MEHEEFEAMMKQAQALYPDTPLFMLRVALKASLREEELQKSKKLPKKKHLIDMDDELEDKWKRNEVIEKEYNGIQVIGADAVSDAERSSAEPTPSTGDEPSPSDIVLPLVEPTSDK